MAYSKVALLEKALEVTKENARGGSSRPAEIVLRNVYEELKKLNQDIEQ